MRSQFIKKILLSRMSWWESWRCLFGLSSHPRIFHSYGDITVTSEGLQTLIYARHSWPLTSEGSLACHTFCDTAHPFIMVISEDTDNHTYCWAFGSGAVTTCFCDLGLSRLGFEHPNFRLRDQPSNLLRHRLEICFPILVIGSQE